MKSLLLVNPVLRAISEIDHCSLSLSPRHGALEEGVSTGIPLEGKWGEGLIGAAGMN